MARPGAPVRCGRSCLLWRDVHHFAILVSNDEPRLGRELIRSARSRIPESWDFEFTRDGFVRERGWSPKRLWNPFVIDRASFQRHQHSEAEPQRTFDTCSKSLLVLARDAKIIEEKDRVFGIMGIRAIVDRVHAMPDYTLSSIAIYQDVTAQ